MSKIVLQDTLKYCIMDGINCKEEYKKCEYYKGNDKTICESIILNNKPLTKCSLTENGCEEISKKCEDISSEELEMYCTNIKPQNENKYCAFTNKGCEEHYTECEKYEGNNKDECESIIVKNNIITNPHITKCVYENEQCISKNKICSDYKSGQDPDFCENIELSDNEKHCALINNQCIEKYKECELYKGEDKSECENNIPKYDVFNKKCVYNEEEKLCTTQSKTCSDYDIDTCGKYELTDGTKRCLWINNQCLMRDTECSYYEGSNKEECETIIPITDTYESKCVYSDGNCKPEKKNSCKDYKEGQEFDHCFLINLADEEKYCTLNENNECVEQFKECSGYKGDDINICESNIPYDLTKCSFENGECNTMEKVECSSYKRFIEKEECEKYNDLLINKKCVFSDYQCIEKDKLCKEIESSATKEICENASTSSSDMKCILSQNKCIEVDKNYQQDKENESESLEREKKNESDKIEEKEVSDEKENEKPNNNDDENIDDGNEKENKEITNYGNILKCKNSKILFKILLVFL